MSRRPGIALLIALVMLLLVEGMAAGMLALAMHARLIAASQLRTANADAAAHLAAQTVLARWPDAGFDTLAQGAVLAPPTGRGTAGDVAWASTVERLAASSFLLRSEARVGGGTALSVGRAVAVARTLDRDAVLRQFNAAVTSAGLLVLAGQSRIQSEPATLPPAWSDSLCLSIPYRPAAAALLSGAPPVVSETVELAGSVVLDTTLAFAAQALGNLSWSEVPQIADTTVGEAVVLAADTSYRLTFADGDLTLSGAGQGILMVNGVLTILAGSTFTGLIVARDGLSVGPDARIFGAIASQGGYALFADATVAYSDCALARITLLTPAADRAAVGRRRFIPVF
jgi:hypothetical protein